MKVINTAAAALILLQLTGACADKKAQKFASGNTQPVRSEEVAKALVEQPSSKAEIKKLRDSSWRQLFLVVTRISSNKAFTIDGLNFDGVKQAAYDLESEVDILDDRFGTLGEYIDQSDIYLPPTSTAASFREAIEKAHQYFQAEGEWDTVKDLFETGGYEELLSELDMSDPLGQGAAKSGMGSGMQSPEVEEAETSLCQSEDWKTGRDPAVLGNMAACARALTARENDPKATPTGGDSFGIETKRYLDEACSALFVLTVATASASIAAAEVCDIGL